MRITKTHCFVLKYERKREKAPDYKLWSEG
jgi:hypothetical protein